MALKMGYTRVYFTLLIIGAVNNSANKNWVMGPTLNESEVVSQKWY